MKKSVTIILVFVLFTGFILTLNQYFGFLENINWGSKWVFVPNFLNLIFSFTIVATIFLIIFERGKPSKTIAWILVLVLFPLIGMLLYLYFGRNYRKNKIFSRKGLADFERIDLLSKNQIEDLSGQHFNNSKIFGKINIIKLLLNNSKALLTENNEVEILNNGEATFDSILDELRNARDHIHLEYYRFRNDKIGRKIKRILIQKAQQGVQVRVIYDKVGSWSLDRRFLRGLRKRGVEIVAFMPIRFPFFANKVNYRNHRKIIVVDGKIGFVGGINIADKYVEGDPELGFWRDTHLKIVGDAVHSLQAIFLTDWYFSSEKIVQGDQFFPKHDVAIKSLVQITASGPDSDWASIMQAYFSAITTADHYIYISTPYFMPNESILTAIKTAALSGVDVKIVLPGRSDLFLYDWSSNSYIEELLEAGVNIYVYRKGFTHSKLLMVDGIFCSVGTANMDVRSFDQNFEVNALVYDTNITTQLEKLFMEDIENSEKIILDNFQRRPFIKKLQESIGRIFTPLL
ncbi:cardiolipin synthase [Fulvivirgaceae bacterium BMA10]|uniref:Cardiolipin synthase n=1 Tax=Splendidivirga corallicola TaxID=3051826 RepID=A0ABT8KQC0_9BACT|nr:cardiolipin synthase [Fulvivirgaceae bacterium BMA10]